jgi:hypothetical protein
VLKLSNRFFGAAVAGARFFFFFGFRPRLLGMGKRWVLVLLNAKQVGFGNLALNWRVVVYASCRSRSSLGLGAPLSAEG